MMWLTGMEGGVEGVGNIQVPHSSQDFCCHPPVFITLWSKVSSCTPNTKRIQAMGNPPPRVTDTPGWFE